MIVSPTATIISVTLTSSPPISGTFTSTIAEAVGAVATTGAVGASATGAVGSSAAGAAPAASNTSIGVPVETLSPTFTKISFTTPASGAGTSIEALSPSTLMID